MSSTHSRPDQRIDPPDFVGAFARPGHGVGELALPGGLSVGPDGDIWVADSGNDRVQAFTRHGKASRVLGERTLSSPADVAVAPGGAVFVADTGHRRVVRFHPDGSVVREYGGGRLQTPRGVVLGADGLLYVSDSGINRVLAFDSSDGTVQRVYRRQMSGPQGLALDDAGNLWVAQNTRFDDYAPPLVGYRSDTTVLATIGDAASSTFGGLSNPAHLVWAGRQVLLVTDGDFGWTTMFGSDGTFVGTFGSERPMTMRFPSGMARAGQDLYIADGWRAQILHYRVAS